MEIFGPISILYLLATSIAIYYRPNIIIGVQLFATPIFGLALKTLGIGIGSVFTILGLTAFSLFLTVRRNRLSVLPQTASEIAILVFILWMAVTLIYTPSPNYGAAKLIKMLAISFPYVYISRVYCGTPEKMQKVFVNVGWMAVFYAIFFIVYLIVNPSETSRIRSDFFGPLTLGYISVSMIPFIFAAGIYTRGPLRIIAIATIPFVINVMVSTGSRGPLLALVVGTTLALLRFQKLFRVFIGLSVVAIGGYIYARKGLQSDNKSLERIFGQNEVGAGGTASDGRSNHFSSAIEQFLQYPLFGQGSGSYSIFVLQFDTRYYAHNIFLSIAGELGLVGLVIFGTVVTMSLLQIQLLRRHSSRLFNRYYWVIACTQALFVMGLINSLLSFDLPTQRILYVGIGLLAATTKWYKKVPSN